MSWCCPVVPQGGRNLPEYLWPEYWRKKSHAEQYNLVYFMNSVCYTQSTIYMWKRVFTKRTISQFNGLDWIVLDSHYILDFREATVACDILFHKIWCFLRLGGTRNGGSFFNLDIFSMDSFRRAKQRFCFRIFWEFKTSWIFNLCRDKNLALNFAHKGMLEVF